jgi:hypothetical protein
MQVMFWHAVGNPESPPPVPLSPPVHTPGPQVPEPQFEHAFPFAPQTAAAPPGWHMPFESQHPMQFSGPQVPASVVEVDPSSPRVASSPVVASPPSSPASPPSSPASSPCGTVVSSPRPLDDPLLEPPLLDPPLLEFRPPLLLEPFVVVVSVLLEGEELEQAATVVP